MNTQAMLKNWQTTASGVLTVISVLAGAGLLLLDGDPDTNPEWGTVIGAVLVGVGLISARDADKSSKGTGVE